MRKILVITTVLIVFGVVGLMLFLPQENPLKNITQGSANKTLSSLVKESKNQKCTWEKTEEGVKMTGTVYTSGNKFAMDTEAIAGQTALRAHLVGNGKTIYTWTDSATQGAAMQYDMLESETNKEGLIYQKMNYKCSNWVPEDAKFTAPKQITFE